MAPLLPLTADHLPQRCILEDTVIFSEKGTASTRVSEEKFWRKQTNKAQASCFWKHEETCQGNFHPRVSRVILCVAPSFWAPPASRPGLGFPIHSAQSHLSAQKTGTTVLANYFSSLFFAELGIEPRAFSSMLDNHCIIELHFQPVSHLTHDEINAWRYQ